MLNHNIIRVLTIDLGRQKIKVQDREDLFEYLGGIGIAMKLFDELVNPDLDPLHPDQPIIFAIGPMEYIFPVITKVACVFRSPLTGELGESYAGLRLGLAMRFAGYDAIVITGKSEHPVYLSITPYSVDFKNAEALWGLTAEEAGRIIRDMEPGEGLRSSVRIGQGGERQVKFANLIVDTYRHFGRLGAGAVFGSKNLKAIAIHGDKHFPIPNKKEYQKTYVSILTEITDTEVMEKYHGLGTAVNVLPLSSMNALPTRNLQQSSFEGAGEISGEAFAEEHLFRKIACSGCPIGCIHIGLHRRQFGDGWDFEFVSLSYDHELIFSLGSFLGIRDKNAIFALIERVELYGIDVITTGVLLGWLTEGYQKGIISKEQVLVDVEFGNAAPYLEVIQNIIEQPNDFYHDLGKGSYYAAQKYGGQDFAMTLGGLEMAGYHTGYAHILGQSVGARHSHLDNAGYSIDQALTEYDPDKIVQLLIKEECERNVLNSLVACLFSRKVYDFKTIEKALNSIGYNWNEQQLLELGEKIFRLKHQVKKRLGFDMKNLTVPKRFFETPSLNGKLNSQVFNTLLAKYIKQVECLTSNREVTKVKVTVEMHKSLREHAKREEVAEQIEVPEGTTLKQIGEMLQINDNLIHVAMVNDERQEHDYQVRDGDRILFLPTVGTTEAEVPNLLEKVQEQNWC